MCVHVWCVRVRVVCLLTLHVQKCVYIGRDVRRSIRVAYLPRDGKRVLIGLPEDIVSLMDPPIITDDRRESEKQIRTAWLHKKVAKCNGTSATPTSHNNCLYHDCDVRM